MFVDQVVGSAGEGIDAVQMAASGPRQQPGPHGKILVMGGGQGQVSGPVLGCGGGGVNFWGYLQWALPTAR
jgi:hypothetical protein